MIIPPDERSVTTSYVNAPGSDKRAIVPAGIDSLLLDGDFNKQGSDTTLTGPWRLGANWTIIAAPPGERPINSAPIFLLHHAPGSTQSVWEGGLGIIGGLFYKITFTIKGYVAGTVSPSVGGQLGSSFSGIGTYTEVIKALDSSFNIAGFTPSSDFDGSITRVNLKLMQTSGTGLLTDTDFTGDGVAENPWTLTTAGTQAFSYDTTNNYIDLDGGAGPSDSAVTQPAATVVGGLYIVRVVLQNRDVNEVVLIALDDTEPSGLVYAKGSGTFLVPIIVGADNAAYNTPASNMVLGESGKLVIETSEQIGELTDADVFDLVEGSPNLLGDLTWDFGSDSDWTKETGWTIGSGVGTCDGTDGARIYQDLNLVSGNNYLVVFEIKSYTSGSVAVELGGQAGNSYSAVGTHMDVITAGTSSVQKGRIAFLSDNYDGDIDNVEIYLVKSVLAGDRRVFDEVHLSAEGSGSIASGTKATMVGSSGIMQQVDVASKGLQRILTERGMYGDKGETTVWTVDPPGTNVNPKLNATVR